ncbi:asparaginyl-tRNA synthetase [Orbilia oligospora]|uniref:Asparaginyl-tRNA synthetase n=1 Tax=Orbilia oligospora TaxID=2813651 RepID=A0A6G1LRW4_ORBOL|nr:asparaginyl-tRNA synthetase [Orbilia oligospora]KAF3231747.1 asparaginyl-tRNA synthetase [Orbilia oligospora]
MSARPRLASLVRLGARNSRTQTLCRRCLDKNVRLLSTGRILRQESNDNGSSGESTATQTANALPTTVRELLLTQNDIKDQAAIKGWVQTIRKQKGVCFATVTDGSTAQTVQVVMTPEQGSALTIGAAAKITGSWQESPVKKAQQKELLATDVKLLAESDPGTYPLQKKSHTFEYLRTIPHLRLRSSTSRSILQLRSTALSQISTYFTENSFTQVQPPILTSSDCEGAGEVFAVTASDRKPFFSDPVYLTVSSQLHLEAVALAMSKVWCMSPTFRAEKSDTARHLNEFYMLEAEMAFVENGIEDVMKVVEGVIKSIVQGLVNNEVLKKDLLIRRSDDVGLLEPEQLEKRWDGIINMPWRRVTYTKAIETLKQAVKRGEDYKARMSSSLNPNSKGALEVQVPWDEGAEFKFPVEWGMNLQSEHEKYLAYAVGGGAPVFITDYPKQLKPFYMLPNSNGNKDEEGRETVACFDLLLPQVGEIVGGSMRENRYDMLEGEMKRRGMSEESIQQLGWYLELRKWGCAPLGGFGIGFDRLLAYLAGVENIRETVAFPRWFDRCLC